MKLETLKKAEDFKQGHLNLVQYFLKKGCTFSVEDIEEQKMTLEKSSNYEDIKKPPTMMHGRGCVVWCGGGVVYALIIFRPVKRFC